MPDEQTKRCRSCDAEKPLGDFGRNASRRDGLHYYCRSCVAERSRRYRARNPEKVRIYKRRWAKTAKGKALKRRERERNRERYATRERKRRAQKPEAIMAQQRVWAERNLEHLRRYKREYQRNHPRPRLGVKHLDPLSVEMVPVLRGDPCSYCGAAASEIDHIVPTTKDGENEWTNFTASCGRCNRSKNNRSLLTFLRARPDYR